MPSTTIMTFDEFASYCSPKVPLTWLFPPMSRRLVLSGVAWHTEDVELNLGDGSIDLPRSLSLLPDNEWVTVVEKPVSASESRVGFAYRSAAPTKYTPLLAVPVVASTGDPSKGKGVAYTLADALTGAVLVEVGEAQLVGPYRFYFYCDFSEGYWSLPEFSGFTGVKYHDWHDLVHKLTSHEAAHAAKKG